MSLSPRQRYALHVATRYMTYPARGPWRPWCVGDLRAEIVTELRAYDSHRRARRES